MTDIEGVSAMISPDARQSFLLSSNTVFKFSIQTASTGPSKIIHLRPLNSEVDSSLFVYIINELLLKSINFKRYIPEDEGDDTIDPFVSDRIELAK